MANHAALYNSLSSVTDADEKFVNREETLSKLAPLLAAHGNTFGVCLVHRHCTLEEGEMMVATDNVCQPERDVECYPDRWLATGEPFEFTRTPSPTPSPALFEEFQKIVGAIGVLALFYVQEEQREGKVFVERTEGRKSIVQIMPHGFKEETISTGWLPWISTGNICKVLTMCVKSTHRPPHKPLPPLFPPLPPPSPPYPCPPPPGSDLM